jgi:hypothetical protein
MPVSQAKQNPRPKKQEAQKTPAKPEFICDYCKKSFQLEQTFLVHMCEPKRRWLDKDTKYVKLGFYVFQCFHEANTISRKPKTFEDFMRSKFYAAFTHFGKYLNDLNAINPKEFIKFLIKTGVKLNQWEHAKVYETYVRELNKKETPEAAIERNFLLMQQWANDTDEVWTDFFRKISPNLATLWIGSGRISPWVLFLSQSGPDLLLNRLSEEQRNLVFANIDPTFWDIKFRRAQEESDFIRDTLHAAGI